MLIVPPVGICPSKKIFYIILQKLNIIKLQEIEYYKITQNTY